MKSAQVTRAGDDQKLAARVAHEAGARVIPLAAGAGAVKDADTYIEAIDDNVRLLTDVAGR